MKAEYDRNKQVTGSEFLAGDPAKIKFDHYTVSKRPLEKDELDRRVERCKSGKIVQKLEAGGTFERAKGVRRGRVMEEITKKDRQGTYSTTLENRHKNAMWDKKTHYNFGFFVNFCFRTFMIMLDFLFY